MVVGEREESCFVRFWMMLENGEVGELPVETGIKLMVEPGGNVRRFVRSKV